MNNNNENEFVWDPNRCPDSLQIINPKKVVKLGVVNWKDTFSIGTIEFKKNTSIYSWQLKVIKLKNTLNVLAGVVKSDLIENNEFHLDEKLCNKTYSWLTQGLKYNNTGRYIKFMDKPIKRNLCSMVMDLELNTFTDELKCKLYNDDGTILYLSDCIPNIPFPCHPIILIITQNTEVELINFESKDE
eukprot:TRINITY_DN2052_c2_g1_i1.p1 TRINITY_DN2052_c2_g1~~TRINITY_DN2052_c2_g1_i1.p1  ORF type:complete len:187 (+),score=31.92 TRINITY_DN2052_c2_g1_i1:135-695(+)